MLPVRWRRSTSLTELMNTSSSFLWNGDLNSPSMEVFLADNDKKHIKYFILDRHDWSLFMIVFFSDTVDSITPDKVRGLRDMLNSSAMDIMYYTSPLYRDEVYLNMCTLYSHNFSVFFLTFLKISYTDKCF